MRFGEFYPPEAHDWVPAQEIRDIAKENANRLEAKYFDDVTQLRAAFVLKLMELGIEVGQQPAWALFGIENDEAEGSVASMGHISTEAALILQPSEQHKQSSQLRVIRREFHTSEHGSYFLVEDAMIGKYGRTTYMVDSITIDESDRDLDPDLNFTKSSAPFYFSNEEGLILANSRTYPQLLAFDGEVRPGEVERVTPFGTWKGYDDRCYALSKLEQFQSEIVDLSPYSSSTSP